MVQRAENRISLKFKHALRCDLVAETLRVSGGVRLRVFGASMLPSVWPGDILTIRHTVASEVKPGELVLWDHSGGLIVHRVVRNAADGLITRGDALPACDPPVMSSHLLGKVTSIQRGRARFAPKGKLNCPQRLLRFLILRCGEIRTLLLRLHALRLRLNRTAIQT